MLLSQCDAAFCSRIRATFAGSAARDADARPDAASAADELRRSANALPTANATADATTSAIATTSGSVRGYLSSHVPHFLVPAAEPEPPAKRQKFAGLIPEEQFISQLAVCFSGDVALPLCSRPFAFFWLSSSSHCFLFCFGLVWLLFLSNLASRAQPFL